jgi:hypothetical protein
VEIDQNGFHISVCSLRLYGGTRRAGIIQASWPFVIMKLEGCFNKKMEAYLFRSPLSFSDISTILEQGQDLLDCGFLLLELLDLKTLATPPSQLLHGLECLFGELDILDSQLLTDDGQIPNWVNVALNVDNLGVVEATDNLEDGINGTDVRQESISETGTSRSSSSQPSNIVDGKMSRDSGFGLVLFAKPVVSVIGYQYSRFFGVNGSEGEVLSLVSTGIVRVETEA